MADLVAGQHGAHQLVESRTILGNGWLGLDLSLREIGAHLDQAALDALIDDERVAQQGANAGRDLLIQRPGVGASNLHSRQLRRTAGVLVLPPKSSELHERFDPFRLEDRD